MTEKDIQNLWAASRVEAMADGSLDLRDRARMEAAMRDDPALAREVETARRLCRALEGLPRPRPPQGLRGRLLGLPPRRRAVWPLLAEAGGAIAVAVLTVLLVTPWRQPPLDEQEIAVRDFVIAMNYLQRSALLTQNEVGAQVGAGVADAFRISRQSLVEAAQTIE